MTRSQSDTCPSAGNTATRRLHWRLQSVRLCIHI